MWLSLLRERRVGVSERQRIWSKISIGRSDHVARSVEDSLPPPGIEVALGDVGEGSG